MDPISLITGGMSAVAAGLKFAEAAFGAGTSIADFISKVFDGLSGLIKDTQSSEVADATDQSTSGLPQDQQDYFRTTNSGVFSTGEYVAPSTTTTSQQPLLTA